MRFLHFLFHWWQTVRDTGKTVYQECAVCRKRRAWQRNPGIGAQPINYRWVAGGEFDVPLKLPTGGSSTADLLESPEAARRWADGIQRRFEELRKVGPEVLRMNVTI